MNTQELIRSIRRRRRWNTARLGRELGVSGRTVENWEQGRPVSGPALKLLAKLARTSPDVPRD